MNCAMHTCAQSCSEQTRRRATPASPQRSRLCQGCMHNAAPIRLQPRCSGSWHDLKKGTPLVSGPPDFLGGRCGVVQCNDCGCERPTLLSDDCRVHDVLQSELRATMGDPIAALQSRLFDESQVRGVDNCSCGSRSCRSKSWYIASCFCVQPLMGRHLLHWKWVACRLMRFDLMQFDAMHQ